MAIVVTDAAGVFNVKHLVFSAALRHNTLYEKVSYSKGVYFSGTGTGCFGHYF
jgi:hypothetical protein